MKYCPSCNQNKPLSDFHQDASKSDGRRTRCGTCRQLTRNLSGELSSQAHRDRVINRIKRNQEYIRERKSIPCFDCGNGYPSYVMGYHHIRGPKLFTLSSRTAHGASRKRIDEEIDKCDILCANCHLIRHGGDTVSVPQQLLVDAINDPQP